MECLNEDAQKYIGGRAVLIDTGTKLLDTYYVFYGLNDDLIDTINYSEYHCHTAGFSKNKTWPRCYVYNPHGSRVF